MAVMLGTQENKQKRAFGFESFLKMKKIAAFCSVSKENIFDEIWQNDLAAATYQTNSLYIATRPICL